MGTYEENLASLFTTCESGICWKISADPPTALVQHLRTDIGFGASMWRAKYFHPAPSLGPMGEARTPEAVTFLSR